MSFRAESSIEKLLKIMSSLRHPDWGCPWDLDQCPDSITPYTIEEAYEVVDAVQSGDPDYLKEELGDLLLQVVFYCQMAEENKQFRFDEVVDGINEKLIRRHPHVFPGGDLASFGEKSSIENAVEVEKAWEKIKEEEKPRNKNTGVLDGVGAGLPPLKRARKLQKAAKMVGFDWEDVCPAIEKVEEEIKELKDAVKNGNNHEHVEEELGDVLFASVNVSRFLKLDPEVALLKANRKFETRFALVEKYVKESKRNWEDYSIDELEIVWENVKQNLSR